MIKQRSSGPRCAGCGQPFTPRTMRDGSLSQTCGRTACVALHNRRKNEGQMRPTEYKPRQNFKPSYKKTTTPETVG